MLTLDFRARPLVYQDSISDPQINDYNLEFCKSIPLPTDLHDIATSEHFEVIQSEAHQISFKWNSLYFCKIGKYYEDKKELNQIKNEALISRTLHKYLVPNYLHITAFCWLKNDIEDVNTYMIVYPLIKGVDLSIFLKKDISVNVLFQIFQQVFYALYEANQKVGFTHYDLHPGNVVIEELDTPVNIYYETLNKNIETRYYAYIIDYGYSYIDNAKTGKNAPQGFIYKKTWWLHDVFKLLMFTYSYLYASEKTIHEKFDNINYDVDGVIKLDREYGEKRAQKIFEDAIIKMSEAEQFDYEQKLNKLQDSELKEISYWENVEETDESLDALDNIYDKYTKLSRKVILLKSKDLRARAIEYIKSKYSKNKLKIRLKLESIFNFFQFITPDEKNTFEASLDIYKYHAVPLNISPNIHEVSMLDFLHHTFE